MWHRAQGTLKGPSCFAGCLATSITSGFAYLTAHDRDASSLKSIFRRFLVYIFPSREIRNWEDDFVSAFLLSQPSCGRLKKADAVSTRRAVRKCWFGMRCKTANSGLSDFFSICTNTQFLCPDCEYRCHQISDSRYEGIHCSSAILLEMKQNALHVYFSFKLMESCCQFGFVIVTR